MVVKVLICRRKQIRFLFFRGRDVFYGSASIFTALVTTNPGIYPVDRYYLKSVHVSMTSPFSVPAQLGMFYIKFIKQPVL